MKGSELRKLLKKYGCYFDRDGGNHEIWYSPITKKQFPVPRHADEVKKRHIKFSAKAIRY